MIKVYTAANPVDAHFVRNLLASAEIEAVVQDENTFSNRGEVPVVYPSVWVRDEDVPGAQKIVEAFEREKKNPPAKEPWTCPKCGERIEGQFTECWKCASSDGHKPLAPAPNRSRPARSDSFLLAIIIPVALLLTSVVGYLVFKEFSKMENAQRHYAKGSQLYIQRKWDAAITEFSQAINLDPQMSYAYLSRAYCNSEKRNYAAAIPDFNMAIALDPRNVEAHIYRGIAHYQLFDYNHALSDLNFALTRRQDPVALVWRGFTQQQFKKNDEALADFEEALKIDPNNSGAMEGRLSISFEAGDFESLESGARDLMKSFPNCSGAYNYLGLALGERGQNKEAVEQFNKAIELGDEAGWYHANRAFYRSEIGEIEQAIDDYGEALKRSAFWGFVRNQRGRLYERIGEKNKAADEYAETLKCNITVSEHHIDHAYAYAAQGNFDEALERVKMVANEPHNHWMNYHIARVYGRIARSSDVEAEMKKKCIDAGIEALKGAQERGFINWKHAESDIDLIELRKDPRYSSIPKPVTTPAVGF